MKPVHRPGPDLRGRPVLACRGVHAQMASVPASSQHSMDALSFTSKVKWLKQVGSLLDGSGDQVALTRHGLAQPPTPLHPMPL
jgi:hypothetical protein